MKQTQDQQVKKVVTGMALGVLAQGVEAVTSSKMALEFAFNHAWRSWPQAYQFPRDHVDSLGAVAAGMCAAYVHPHSNDVVRSALPLP